jgi:TonB family protein
MRWAIIGSLVIHSFFIVLVFTNSEGKTRAYPKVIPVRLASPPPLRGVEKSTAAEAPAEKAVQKTKKADKPDEKTRMAEINKRKKPKRKAPEPKPSVKEEPSKKKATESQNAGLPEGVELGSEFGSARLDAVGFDSPYYLNVLFSKIRSRWDNPYEGMDSVHCVIYFVVDRGGRISDSAIEKSSGFASYDHAALRAVLAAKPPPLPNQFGSNELGIHLEFKYLPYN